MKAQDIVIRDPYVLLHEGVYYLYGTRSTTCWGPADGFDCYTSTDLVEWNGPIEIFHRPDGFFADQNYWAPECYFYQGKFYLITTLGCGDRKKGIYVLTADRPDGPFVPVRDVPLTPKDWTCIDGSLYFGEHPYLLFSHSFEDDPKGEMYAMELADDLTAAAGEPKLLFIAPDAAWAKPVPFAKQEFGMDGDVYFTDGPCVYKMENGKLALLWSSWSDHGYAVGTAYADDIYGPWTQVPEKFFPENGGHGMMFRGKDGQLLYALHYPNDFEKEHPVFMKVHEADGKLTLSE